MSIPIKLPDIGSGKCFRVELRGGLGPWSSTISRNSTDSCCKSRRDPSPPAPCPPSILLSPPPARRRPYSSTCKPGEFPQPQDGCRLRGEVERSRRIVHGIEQPGHSGRSCPRPLTRASQLNALVCPRRDNRKHGRGRDCRHERPRAIIWAYQRPRRSSGASGCRGRGEPKHSGA